MSGDLEDLLKQKIKLYEHLGLEIQELGPLGLRFRVSLQDNLNHKGTAFGGSLYAAAVTSAYALVFHGLRERKIPTENIVIQKGDIQYYKPVEQDFDVVCKFASQAAADEFYGQLVRDGRVKDTLVVNVSVGGDLKAEFKGTFVVKM